jgi:hypothetical protein
MIFRVCLVVRVVEVPLQLLLVSRLHLSAATLVEVFVNLLPCVVSLA